MSSLTLRAKLSLRKKYHAVMLLTLHRYTLSEYNLFLNYWTSQNALSHSEVSTSALFVQQKLRFCRQRRNSGNGEMITEETGICDGTDDTGIFRSCNQFLKNENTESRLFPCIYVLENLC